MPTATGTDVGGGTAPPPAHILREHGVGLAAWAWAACYLFWTRTEPLRLNWGDPWSDCNVQTSGRYFARYGFVRNAFTPIIDVGPLTAESTRYTHYPPLPDLVNGLQQRILGESDIATYRVAADVLTLVGLYFFYRWVRALWGGVAANVALVLCTTSLLWLQYADTIHHIPLYTFFGWATLHFAARWLEKRRRIWLVLAAGAVFFCDLASYDYVFVVPILVATTLWVKGHRLRDRTTWPLLGAVAGGVIASVVTKLGLVGLSVGFGPLVHDFVFQLQERTASKQSFANRSAFGLMLFWRSMRFFTPLVFVVLASHIVGLPACLLRRTTRLSVSPLLVLLAAIPFLALFAQLFLEQYHPTLLLLPYYAIGGGTLFAWLWERGRLSRAVAVGGLVFAVAWEQREAASFEKLFLPREDIAAVRAYLPANDHQRFVMTNLMIDAPIRAYFDRHTLGIGSDTAMNVAIWATAVLDETGGEPFHFVRVANVERIAFDKTLYAEFARFGKWDWISNPTPHKAEWMGQLRHRDEIASGAIAQVARLVVDHGTMKVYAFDRAALDQYLEKEMGPEETRVVSFGEVSSYKHKIQGIRSTEVAPDGTGFSWTTSRQRKELKFSLKGPAMVPVAGSSDPIAKLRIRARPRPSMLRLELYAEISDQTVEVRMNGHSLGSTAVPRAWGDHAFAVPEAMFDPSGLQIIELRPTRLSAGGTGVALRTLRIEPNGSVPTTPTPAP